jgi:hypothetical protein
MRTRKYYRIEFKSRNTDRWLYFMQFNDEISAKRILKGLQGKNGMKYRLRPIILGGSC